MIALLAPGQGSQTPGMLAEWLNLPGAADRIGRWSQISGLDLALLGTTATAEEITDTAVTQPLVVATTLLAHAALAERGLPAADATVVAGHSVGEIAASIGMELEDFLPLAQNALSDVIELGPRRALTGPAARGDVATLDAHLEAIPESTRPLYVALIREALALGEQRRAGSPA